MSQHFLLSAAARTVSLKQILRMEEDEAWAMFCSIRWPETSGAPVCPHCGCPTCWSCPRPNGAPRFRCSACRRDFSPTSGTLFAFHKLEIRDYLAAVVIFCDEVKGKAALALSRDLDVQYKTAFVLAHKIRESCVRNDACFGRKRVNRRFEVADGIRRLRWCHGCRTTGSESRPHLGSGSIFFGLDK